MKKTFKILSILILGIAMIASCKKDNPEPNGGGSGGSSGGSGGGSGGGGGSTSLNIFDVGDMLFSFEYIDFVDDNEGYAIGQTDTQLGSIPTSYTVLKSTGDNKWEVLNANMPDGGRVSPENYFIVKGGKAYATAGRTNNNAYLFAIDFKTGVITEIGYDESLITGATPLPAVESMIFYTPSTQNGNIIAGMALDGQFSSFYYVYFIDTTTDKIVKMEPINVIEEYKLFNAQNEYIGCKLNPYRANVHLFSDNSFIVGPIAHPQTPTNLDYIFMTYNNTGWSNEALTMSAHDGVDVMTHYFGTMGIGNHYGTGIYGDKTGDELYYLELSEKNGLAYNAMYKISNKGQNISQISLTEKQMKSNYISIDEAGTGFILQRAPLSATLWFTKDAGNSWTAYNTFETAFIPVRSSAHTTNYYYFASDVAIKTDVSARPGIVRRKK